MCNLMGIPYGDNDIDRVVSKVMSYMWKYGQTYSIGILSRISLV